MTFIVRLLLSLYLQSREMPEAYKKENMEISVIEFQFIFIYGMFKQFLRLKDEKLNGKFCFEVWKYFC